MDIAANNDLEDGEISDEDDTLLGYIPLKRPEYVSSNIRASINYSDDESDASSVSDNSDSDDASRNRKKSKLKVNRKIVAQSTSKKKKYDIWCSHNREELAGTLTTFDVGEEVNRICYGVSEEIVEPRVYNDGCYFDKNTNKRVPLQKLNEDGNKTRKRRHDERNNTSYTPIKRNTKVDHQLEPRVLPKLTTTEESSEVDLAADITNKLCEYNDGLILNIVQIAGKKKSIELFEHTREIEAAGGMLVMNGTKRRTPGGVFICLVKQDDDITTTQQREIFAESKRESVRRKREVKREKARKIKAEIQQRKETLPDLLNRADLEMMKIDKRSDQRESEPEECVKNPPPSPVTDGKDNSSDGMSTAMPADREVNSYDDDYLDLGDGADMDIF